MTLYSDRSRYNAYQHCPRERYLEYHLMGTGIRRNRIAIPLMTGIVVHAGRAHMLNQVVAMGDVPRADLKVNVDKAVAVALDEYRAELKVRGLDVELGENAQAVVDEQMALTEGLLRAYAKAGLPRLLEQYRVIEVEREETWPAFTHRYATAATGIEPPEPIDFQARADALLQERSTGDLYIDSLKTAATFDYRKDAENRHDVQGLSEAVGVERRLRHDWDVVRQTNVIATDELNRFNNPSYRDFLLAMTQPPRIMGIQMTFLVKGIRRQAYDGAPYATSSPLLRGFYREGVTEREFAWKEETPCPGPGHVLKQGKKGPILCEGKKFHKLGEGWTKFDTYRNDGPDLVGGVAEWIEMLASGTMQPDAGDPFEGLIQMPIPYFRQDQDVMDWVEQAQAQESEVAAKAAQVEAVRVNEPKMLRSVLNRLFAQNRRSCDWPSKCQFQEVCFGDDSMLTNPMATGLYQVRVPHHEAELGATKLEALK